MTGIKFPRLKNIDFSGKFWFIRLDRGSKISSSLSFELSLISVRGDKKRTVLER